MFKKLFSTMMLSLLTITLISCTSEERRVAGYGTGGAALGALTGAALKNNSKGAVRGAAIGAVAGTLLGVATTRNGQQYCNYRDVYGRVFQAPCN